MQALFIDAGFYSRKKLISECAPKWWECLEPSDLLNIGLLLTLMTFCFYLALLPPIHD